MTASKKSLQGHGMIILNVIRAFNVSEFVLMSGAQWIMIVKSGLSGQFMFFDFATHLFVFALAMLLLMTEVGWPAKYINRTWPQFGEDRGFLVLGGIMIALGCLTVSDLAKPAYFIESLGLPLWRTVMAAGILSIVFGFFNVIATFLFEDRNANISARRVRSAGYLAKSSNDEDYYHGGSGSSSGGHSVRHEKDSGYHHQQAEAGGWQFAQKAKRLTQVFTKKMGGGFGGHEQPEEQHPASRGGASSRPTISAPQPPQPPQPSMHPLYRTPGNFDDGLGGNSSYQRNDSMAGDPKRWTRYSTTSVVSQFSEAPRMPAGPYDNLPGGKI